jgi:hypothetical protein
VGTRDWDQDSDPVGTACECANISFADGRYQITSSAAAAGIATTVMDIDAVKHDVVWTASVIRIGGRNVNLRPTAD